MFVSTLSSTTNTILVVYDIKHCGGNRKPNAIPIYSRTMKNLRSLHQFVQIQPPKSTSTQVPRIEMERRLTLAENLELKRKVKALEREKMKIMRGHFGTNATKISTNLNQLFQGKPLLKTAVTVRMVNDDADATAHVLDKYKKIQINQQNTSMRKETHSWKSLIRFSVHMILKRISFSQIDAFKKATGMQTSLATINGYIGTIDNRTKFECGVTKDINPNSEAVRKTVKKWYTWNHTYDTQPNMFEGFVEGAAEVSHVALRNPGAAFMALAQMQLTSPITRDKHHCHASNFVDQAEPPKIPLICVDRLDGLGMARAHGTKTVSILSWQILGWIAFFFNMVVTFMVAAIWQCGDDKYVTIESTKRFKALLSESLKNQPELTIEYNGMEYVLDTENIKHVSIMDGKCFNAAVHHM
eukprot:1160626_1